MCHEHLNKPANGSMLVKTLPLGRSLVKTKLPCNALGCELAVQAVAMRPEGNAERIIRNEMIVGPAKLLVDQSPNC